MHQHSWAGFTRTALAAAAIVVCAPAFAQNTTSAVGGQITGPDGKGLAGAVVNIRHLESGSATNVTTDAEGRYSARGLRVGGPYTITISQGGRTEKRENVFLALAETLSLDAQLGGSTVVITGRADASRLDRSAMGSGTALSSRDLNSYASISGNLQDFARIDPRLSQTDKERGEISAGGQNTRYNSITIDGVTVNDTFGLEANNLPTIKQPISIDAIQSVQINLSNYDVTQKGYTGANINAVTKSGTNELHGSVFFSRRDDSMMGKRFNRTDGSYFDPPPLKEEGKGITLGGPILKDKLFFFGTYSEFKSSRSSPDFGPLGSSATNVGITQSAIDQAIAIAKDKWGIDAGTAAVPSGLNVLVKDALLKLDWNISDEHRASVRYNKTTQTEPNIAGFSNTGLSLSSWWWNQDKQIESVVGQWLADWTPNFSTEVKVSQRDYESRPIPLNGQRLPAIGLRFSGALPAGTPTTVSANNRFLNFGTELSRHLNVLETKTQDAYFGATLTRGAHEMKFGLDYSNNDVYNAFLQNVNGNYTFGCEPGAYTFGTFTDCAQMTPAQRDLATLENFRNGKPSSYTLQAPLAGRTLNDAIAIWSYANTGLFFQDTWKVNDKLNVTLGLRMDQADVPEKPLANTDVALPLVKGSVNGTTVVRNTGGFGMDNTTTLDGNKLLQPRLGFNLNLGTPEQRMQVRGGLGLFQGAAANVWLSNPFSNTGKAAAVLTCTSFGACNTANAAFSPNPDTQPRLTGTPPAPNVDIISKDLEQPSVWKANLAFDAELPPLPVVGRLVAGFEWMHTKVDSSIYYQSLNLGGPTAIGKDGRELYYTPNLYNVACWSGSNFVTTAGTACAGGRQRGLSNANFNNVYLATRTSKGGGDAVTLSIGQPASTGLGWNLAYTKTTNQEVSPLTSSTSGSNFGNRSIFNPNEEVLQNSNYLVKDRVSATLTYSKAFVSKYKTSFGMFFEGRKGKPYSWTYINDMNGDQTSGNDLMYIPTAPGSGEVVFRGGAAEEAKFWEVVDANSALRSAKGGVVGRNNQFAPWVNNFDVRVSQELPGFLPSHKSSITLDILNFGNLLNKKWGRINEIGFPSNRSFVNFNGLDAQGRYIYSMGTVEDLVTKQAAGESQWALQVTLRYEF